MNRRLVAGILPLVLIGATALQGAPLAASAAETGPVRIGMLSVFDFVDDWMRKGGQMAAEDINAAGGINGRKVELVFENDSALGNQGVKNLIARDIDMLVGPEVFTATQQNTGLIKSRKIINMLPLSPVGEVSDLQNPYVFRLVPYDRIQAEALVKHLVDEKRLKRVAVLFEDDFLGRPGVGLVRDQLKFRGLKPVKEISFNRGDTDMTAQVAALRSAKPDALIVWSLAREAAHVALAVKSLKLPVKIGVPIEAAVGEYIELAGESANGTISVLPHKTINNWAPPGSFRANWFARYHRKFVVKAYRGTKVPNLPIAQAVVYDALMLYAEAAKRAGSTDADAVRRQLESGKPFEMITHNFAFSVGNHETYAKDDLWAFRIDKGAATFAEDPRADQEKERQAWQLFALGLLFDRKKGVALIPYSIGTFPAGSAVKVLDLRWKVHAVKFVDRIEVPYFGIPARMPEEGKFAIVDLEVTNLSSQDKKAPWIFCIDQDANLYIPDPQATAGLWIGAGRNAGFFMFSPLAARSTVRGTVAFDVRSSAKSIEVGVPNDFLFSDYAMIKAL
ncbi:MAG TPA: ABC transporter substrate-binding protein [Actinomycetota bacterium]|nr:ABC transporter substrate-binding protein [Actinomycetota bacterium]